eukprot:jgi/Tetstr1/424300/TSEL_014868.t1
MTTGLTGSTVPGAGTGLDFLAPDFLGRGAECRAGCEGARSSVAGMSPLSGADFSMMGGYDTAEGPRLSFMHTILCRVGGTNLNTRRTAKEISDRNKLWVPEMEAWLGRQFKTDSIAAHTHQLVLNGHELKVHIVMGCEVLTHFVNYQDWKQAFFKAAFPNGIQTTVGDYAHDICIKPSDPKMATCCVDLQRKLQAAFALLHDPFVVPQYLLVQRIFQAIPKHERAEVQKMANHANETFSTHEVLFRHLSAIDEEHRLAVETAKRRPANIKNQKRHYEEYSGRRHMPTFTNPWSRNNGASTSSAPSRPNAQVSLPNRPPKKSRFSGECAKCCKTATQFMNAAMRLNMTKNSPKPKWLLTSQL